MLGIDATQIPAIIAMLASAGTLGGVVKLTRWTAMHDSRVAQLEKSQDKNLIDFDRHVIENKTFQVSVIEVTNGLHDRVGRIESESGMPLHIRTKTI